MCRGKYVKNNVTKWWVRLVVWHVSFVPCLASWLGPRPKPRRRRAHLYTLNIHTPQIIPLSKYDVQSLKLVAILDDKDAEPDLTVKLPDDLDIHTEE